MADKKVSELDAITGTDTAADDLFLIVDTSGSVTKRITRAELNNAIEQDVLENISITNLTSDLSTNGNDINFGDNDKATFGDAAGGDLQIYHDATDSHVVTTNGDLNLQVAGAGTINLGDQFGNTLLKVVDNADVKLYHGTTPSEKLATTSSGIDVTGTVTADGLTVDSSGGGLTFSGGGNTFISATSSPLIFQTSSGTERMRITGTGLVGIGTAAPTFAAGGGVHAKGSSGAFTSFRASVDSNTGVDFSADSSGNGYVFNRDNAALIVGTNNTEAVRITSGGNVGIGDSSPDAKLDVRSTSGTTTDIGIFEAAVGGYTGTSLIAANTLGPASTYNLFECITDSDADAGGPFTEFVIRGDGNVGIGNASPSQLLSVGGDSSGTKVIQVTNSVAGTAFNDGMQMFINDSAGGLNMRENYPLQIYVNGSERMRITSGGNVGIGTSGPSTTLQVGDGSADTRSTFNPSSAFAIGVKNGANHGGFIGSNGSSGMQFSSSGGAHRMTIDSNGNVGIGTNTPVNTLDVIDNGGGAAVVGRIRNEGGAAGDDATLELSIATASEEMRVLFTDSAGTAGQIVVDGGDNSMAFETGTSEAMRIDSSGNLLVGKTTQDTTTDGFQYRGDNDEVAMTRTNNPPLVINRLNNDGTLIVFRQQNTDEGSISVSGTTVSYNGGHLARWSQLTDNTKDTSIVKGTVMTNLDQMAVWTKDGVTEDNEQLNCMAVSSVEGDANVAGVFVNWDDDDTDFTADMNIAMTGDMVIRIASGTTVARGDLLMSAGDGTAKPQGDDIVRSKTIAKVTSTTVSHTYDDGSYLVPCVLMAC